ncbi:spondin-1 [Bactrocera neohumeralis]|uniref:spondin-1 n=1 Tax=Bactrocera neohumeralis TaxID=98809 RepID=UPI0021658655|nr:spondin-1 [Bactrocera neohumeralis]
MKMTVNIYEMLLLLFALVCLCSALPSPEPQPQPEPALLSSYKPSFISNPAIYTYTVAENQAQKQQPQQQKQQQQAQVKQQQQEYTKAWQSNDIDYNTNSNGNSNNNNYFNYASNSNNEQFSSSSSSSSDSASAAYQNHYYTSSKFSGVSLATPTTTTTPATPTQPLPVSGCQLDRLAVYKVVLHTYWTRDLFPKHYPDWRPTAQWTKTLGRTHDASYALFHIGQQATAGVKQFAETGKSDLLDSIVGEQQQQQMHYQQLQQQQNAANGNSFAGFVPTASAVRGGAGAGAGERSVFDEFNIPAVLVGDGRQETKFFVDSNHSMVSLMTRIVPSPDWFIGVDSFQLCVGGSWIDTVTVEMDPLDAGTDNGFTFTAPNWPTSPQGVIYRITSRYPAHPASSFFYPKSKRLPPIATFQFIKLKEYELSEVFNFAEDDRKYETVKTQTHLEAEHDSTITNNELSASIERERQNEISAQPTSVTERDRIRSRLLAKMNPGYNNNSNAAAANGNTANIVPKNDKNAIMQNIASSYQRTEASTNSSATAANWLGPLPKRRRTKSRTKSRDCRVSHWSEWSACSKTCGIGEMHRYRKVIRHGKRGGRPCPALQESKWCGTEKGCHSPATYFNWSTT